MRKPRDGCSGTTQGGCNRHYTRGLKKGQSRNVYPRWLVRDGMKATDVAKMVEAPKWKRDRKTAHLDARGRVVGKKITGRKACKRFHQEERRKKADYFERSKAASYA